MNFLLGGGGPVRPNLPPHLMDEGERGAGLVEKATSDILLAVDWAINMEVVDALNRASDQEVKREIIRQIRKRLQHRSTRVVHMALELIETIVKNCGPSVHREVATPKFMASMARVARSYSDRTGKENLQVADKAMDLIQSWGEAFLPMAQSMPLFSQTYHELRREGMPFRKQYDETKVPIMTPPPSAPLSGGGGGRGQFTFEGEEGGGEGGSGGGERDLLKMAETSETMLHDMLYSIESSHELGSGNEVLHAVVGQCAKLGKALQQEIESKVLTGAEDLEEYFAANDQLQATLHLYEGMKDRSIALPLPQEGRRQGGAAGGGQPEKELMSFDDDFLTGLGSGAGGGGGGKVGEDTKLSVAEVGVTMTSTGGAAAATAVIAAAAAETGAPMLAPSRRDSFGRSRRGSRGSAGSRGAGDDLLDLSNLNLDGSSSVNANANGGGGGGDMLASSATGAFSSVPSLTAAAAAGTAGSQKPLQAPASSSVTDTSSTSADPFASGPPVPILPPPRALGTPPGQQQGSISSSSSSALKKNPSTGLAPQPSPAFFSLPGGGSMGVSGGGGGGMGGGMNGSSSYMSSVGPSLSTSASSATGTGLQALPSSSAYASMGGLSISQSGGGGGGPASMYGAQGGSFAQQHQQLAPSSYPPSLPGGWQQQWPQQQQQQQQQQGQQSPQQWQPAPPQQAQRPASAGPLQHSQQQDNPFDAFM